MQDFTDFVDLVGNMIRDFGTTGVIQTQQDDGEYNPTTGMTNNVRGEVMVQCIVTDRTLQSNGAGVLDKTLIQAGDKMAYVSPTALLIPVLMPNGVLRVTGGSDRLVLGKYIYNIVTIKVLDLSGDGTNPILFELYLRR